MLLNAGQYASTPDPPLGPRELKLTAEGQHAFATNAALSAATGNVLQVTARVKLNDYTPATIATLADQYWDVNNSPFIFYVGTNGTLRAVFSNAVTLHGRDSTATLQSVGITDGQAVSLRTTLVRNNGAGQNVTTFEYSHDDVVWQQLGAPIVVAGVMSPPTAARPTTVGTQLGSPVNQCYGSILYVKVTVDGAIVVDPDFRTARPNAAGVFADSVGNSWSLQNGAAIVDSPLTLKLSANYQKAFTPAPAICQTPAYRTGVVQITARIKLDDYTAPLNACILDQYWGATDSTVTFDVTNAGDGGRVRYVWSNGTSFTEHFSTPIGAVVADGQPISLRVTHVRNSGQNTYYTNFEYSLVEPPVWQQLSRHTSAGTTTACTSSRPLTIGHAPGPESNPLLGTVDYVRYTLDDKVVCDVDFRKAPTVGAAFSDNVGNLWTIQNGATIVVPPIAELDLRIWCALTDYTPAATCALLGKWKSGGSEFIWEMLGGSGNLSLVINDGTNTPTLSAGPPPLPDGGKVWLRVSCLTNSGGNSKARYYYSFEDTPNPTNWISHWGTINAAPTVGLLNTATDLAVGRNEYATPSLVGEVYAASVRVNGVVVANPDFSLPAGNPQMDGVGNLWTVPVAARTPRDDQMSALTAWAANHPEWGKTHNDLMSRWTATYGFGGALRSGSDLAARDAQYVTTASSLSLAALPAGDFRTRQAAFWKSYAAKPPVAAP